MDAILHPRRKQIRGIVESSRTKVEKKWMYTDPRVQFLIAARHLKRFDTAFFKTFRVLLRTFFWSEHRSVGKAQERIYLERMTVHLASGGLGGLIYLLILYAVTGLVAASVLWLFTRLSAGDYLSTDGSEERFADYFYYADIAATGIGLLGALMYPLYTSTRELAKEHFLMRSACGDVVVSVIMGCFDQEDWVADQNRATLVVEELTSRINWCESRGGSLTWIRTLRYARLSVYKILEDNGINLDHSGDAV